MYRAKRRRVKPAIHRDGQKITADVKESEPSLFKWMAFLTGYVIPHLHYSQPVVHKRSIRFTPHVAGFILPQSVKPA